MLSIGFVSLAAAFIIIAICIFMKYAVQRSRAMPEREDSVHNPYGDRPTTDNAPDTQFPWRHTYPPGSGNGPSNVPVLPAMVLSSGDAPPGFHSGVHIPEARPVSVVGPAVTVVPDEEADGGAAPYGHATYYCRPEDAAAVGGGSTAPDVVRDEHEVVLIENVDDDVEKQVGTSDNSSGDIAGARRN